MLSTVIKSNTRYITNNSELETTLLGFMPNGISKNNFTDRLKNANESYWQILSEMRAIHVFNELSNVQIVGVDVKTNGKKDVDFVCDYRGKHIFIEVKGFRPQDYDIAKLGGSYGGGEEKIDRALRRSQNKFLDNACNIVVIADEDTIKPPLFMNALTDLHRTPEIYLNSPDYHKTSAVIILGGMYYDQMFKYKIWYSPDPQCALPPDLKIALDEDKSNIIWPW